MRASKHVPILSAARGAACVEPSELSNRCPQNEKNGFFAFFLGGAISVALVVSRRSRVFFISPRVGKCAKMIGITRFDHDLHVSKSADLKKWASGAP